MWPLAVGVVNEDAEDVLEVAAVEDHPPVKGTRRGRCGRTRSAIAFAFGERTGVLTIRMPSPRKTSSKEPLYLTSRSRMRKRTPLSLKSRPRLRACWVTHS